MMKPRNDSRRFRGNETHTVVGEPQALVMDGPDVLFFRCHSGFIPQWFTTGKVDSTDCVRFPASSVLYVTTADGVLRCLWVQPPTAGLSPLTCPSGNDTSSWRWASAIPQDRLLKNWKSSTVHLLLYNAVERNAPDRIPMAPLSMPI